MWKASASVCVGGGVGVEGGVFGVHVKSQPFIVIWTWNGNLIYTKAIYMAALGTGRVQNASNYMARLARVYDYIDEDSNNGTISVFSLWRTIDNEMFIIKVQIPFYSNMCFNVTTLSVDLTTKLPFAGHLNNVANHDEQDVSSRLMGTIDNSRGGVNPSPWLLLGPITITIFALYLKFNGPFLFLSTKS